ncbi:MAG TPA: YggS family pyridoxal phosphate-dependent enzyme [Myxococcota bacterium]
MNDLDAIAARFADVRARIAAACARAGRDVDDVALVAASKAQSSAAIRAAYAVGQRDFGENYATELRDKREALVDLVDIRWHFIGRVQSSNARVIARAALVHGVGSRSQLDALARASAALSSTLPVLLQVNLLAEDTKNGFAADEARAVVRDVAAGAWPTLQVQGLMAMPFIDDDDDSTALAAAFAAVRALRDELSTTLPTLTSLSMGMSADFELAIVAGATHVRVGTDLFGRREYP